MEDQKQPPDQVVVVIDQPKAPPTTLRRLNYPKPKARFAETNYPIPPKSEELEPLNPYEDSSSDDDDEWFDDVDKEDEEDGKYREQARKRRRINRRALIEWVLFCTIMTGLICSLTLKSLKDEVKWGLKIWKWCLMVMLLFCGRLVSGWVVGFLVFIIERNFMLREKVLYFVYGLRKSFQNCVWLGLVLLAWMIMFPNVHKHNKVLQKAFRALVAVLIAATIWLLKIVMVKVLASSFHVATFFDRMKESVFHHYVLEALSGPPLDEEERDRPKRRVLMASQSLPAKLRDGPPKTVTHTKSSRKIDMKKLRRLSRRASAWSVKRLVSYVRSSGLSTISRTVDDFGKAESEITSEWEARTSAQRIFKNVAKPHAKFGLDPHQGSNHNTKSSRKIDMKKLRRLSRRASAWSVKRLVSYVRSSGLSTISRTVDDFGKAESEITSEWEARTSAQRIFKNVAKPHAKFIEEEDLLRFLTSDEVCTILPLFEGAVETSRITKSSFRNWVVQAYVERKSLAHSLNDTKTAVHQLHKIASAIVIVVIVVVSLLVMGLATSKVILVVTSQLLLAGFVFQNSCKTVFESIIFVFVMHPFDVGDRCVIDGVQMIVEEMNILSTVFLRFDSEKIYFPNSVLLTKPISNFRRSPDMADMIDFVIDFSTPLDTISNLKKAIQTYIEGKPKYWNQKHTVIVKEIENMNKLKMCLCVTHTMNHQNFGEKNLRKTELLFELKRIFESLGIKYHLLPQEVHLTQVNMPMQA